MSDRERAKALYRRGMANDKLGEVKAAKDDLKEAQKLAPGDSDIEKMLKGMKISEA